MNLEILKILNHYNINEKFADKRFIMEICHIISEKAHLDDYINYIEIVDNKHYQNNHYAYITRHLYFNLNRDYDANAKKIFHSQYFYFYNLQVLSSIFHELTHVYQEYLKNSNKNMLLKSILLLSDPTSYLDISCDGNFKEKMVFDYNWKRYQLYYHRKYFSAPVERMAIITSYIAIQKIIALMDLEIDAVFGFNSFIDYEFDETLKYGYKLILGGTNSPTIDYLRRMPHNSNKDILNQYKCFNNLNTSLDERLFTGLYLTTDEYIDLCNIEKAKIKKIDSFLE